MADIPKRRIKIRPGFEKIGRNYVKVAPKAEPKKAETSDESIGLHAQLLKHRDLHTNPPKIRFENGESVAITPNDRNKMLTYFDSLKGPGIPPSKREKTIRHASRSHRNFIKHLDGTYKEEERNPMSAVKIDEAKMPHPSQEAMDRYMDPAHGGPHAGYHFELPGQIKAGPKLESKSPRWLHHAYGDNKDSSGHGFALSMAQGSGDNDEDTKGEIACAKLARKAIHDHVKERFGKEAAEKMHKGDSSWIPSKKNEKIVDNLKKAVEEGTLSQNDFDSLIEKMDEEVEQVQEKALSDKQKKIAAIAGDKDKIDAEDLKALRSGKKTVKEEKENEPKVSAYTESSRFRGVESSIRDVMSKNLNLRQMAKEEEFKRNK